MAAAAASHNRYCTARWLTAARLGLVVLDCLCFTIHCQTVSQTAGTTNQVFTCGIWSAMLLLPTCTSAHLLMHSQCKDMTEQSMQAELQCVM